MNKENKKIEWLNMHCKNNFIISENESNGKFNILFNGKKIKNNLSRHLLNKELDILETKLAFGKDLDKIFKNFKLIK